MSTSIEDTARREGTYASLSLAVWRVIPPDAPDTARDPAAVLQVTVSLLYERRELVCTHLKENAWEASGVTEKVIVLLSAGTMLDPAATGEADQVPLTKTATFWPAKLGMQVWA